jgi:hypothetical protein
MPGETKMNRQSRELPRQQCAEWRKHQENMENMCDRHLCRALTRYPCRAEMRSGL